MKERLKTLLLMVLVGISLVLTKQIWMELPNKVFSKSQDTAENFISDYQMIDMIAPNKYIINFGEQNNHTLFYDESKHSLWTDARKALRHIMETKDLELIRLSKEEYYNYDRKRSISFEFPEKLNTYILAKALEVETTNEIIDTIEDVDSIYIYLGTDEPFFVFSNEDERIEIRDRSSVDVEEVPAGEGFFSGIKSDQEGDRQHINILKEQVAKIDKIILNQKDGQGANSLGEGLPNLDLVIKEQQKYNYYYPMKDLIETESNIYLPYEMNNSLPKIFVQNEIRALDEGEKRDLAERFFRENIDHISEVVENSGSTIYIHDKKVLKLNIAGKLEYFQPLDEVYKKRNLYESMNTAASFISRITGVPEGMYLSNIEKITDENGSEGYGLTFKYRIRGIPVILGNKEVDDFVAMEVFNSHIKSYEQFMRKDMDKKISINDQDRNREMLLSFDIIDENYELFMEDMEGIDLDNLEAIEDNTRKLLLSIRDITLAYYDPSIKNIDEELLKVWAIRTDKGLYVFDVFNGKLIDKKLFKS